MSETRSKQNEADSIAEQILAGIKGRIAWDSLSLQDRTLIAEVVGDAAMLGVRAMATPVNTPAYTALQEEIKLLNASLANLSAAADLRVQDAVWSSARFVAGKFVTLLVQAAVTAA